MNITCEHCKRIYQERIKDYSDIILPESSGVLRMTITDAIFLIKKWEDRWSVLKTKLDTLTSSSVSYTHLTLPTNREV